ncbi:MAG TPA: L-lysine 6-transaminase [Polyangiaceae bacterium]|nr:L-lysine 6-transaminase [Polyangiaceae bacterium]
MFVRSEVPANKVHETLRRHMLADGYPIVVDMEKSSRSWVRDLVSGKEYLDFFSFFASNPIGFNHPSMLDRDCLDRLARVGVTKVSNADYYTTYMAEFVDTLSRTAGPKELPYYFFVDGGALAVENAMKVAFDWKVRKNLAAGRGPLGQQVLHLEQAFHGRSGYTMSVTNMDPVKTMPFPQFEGPRIPAPSIRFPQTKANEADLVAREQAALSAASQAFERFPHDIAAILLEPIQGEGGDNHFRPEFLRGLRKLADQHDAMLIFDEVQTGLGLTGKWWAFEHWDVVPDIICFGKKMQVGGIFVSKRVEEVEQNVFVVPSRINSTWGASLSDMVRCTHILEIIVNERLIDNARTRGQELVAGLEGIQAKFPKIVSNARGRGLMCALDMPDAQSRNQVVQQCFDDGMIVLSCGQHSVRFRPTLTVTEDAIAEGVSRLEAAIGKVTR